MELAYCTLLSPDLNEGCNETVLHSLPAPAGTGFARKKACLAVCKIRVELNFSLDKKIDQTILQAEIGYYTATDTSNLRSGLKRCPANQMKGFR